MNTLFLYARKSTDTEDKQVLSIEAQLVELRAFAEREHLLIVEELIEKQSAKAPGRPIFNSMLNRIESGEATGILAWHPDRLARNSVDGGRIIHLLDTTTLRALKFPQFWFEATPQGKFMLSIAFGQSKYYVDSLAENTKRGLRQKVRRGEYPSLAPVGYLNDSRSRTIVVDCDTAPIVRQAFELYARNGSRLEDIAIFLAQHGIKRKSGKRFHADRVTYLLENPFYYGHFKYGGEIYEGKHQPIIAKKLFDQVQEVLHQRSRPHYKTKNSPPALCGLLSCASCGMMITGERKVKRNKKGGEHHYTYYRCTKKRRDMICPEPCVRQEALDQQLSSLLLSVSLNPEWAAKFREMLAQDETQAAHSVAAFVTDAHAQIQTINKRLQRLLDGYLNQDLERDQYRSEKAKLLADKKSLEEQITRLRKTKTAWLEPLAKWINTAENMRKVATGTDLLQKKAAAQEAFGSNLFLEKKTVQVQGPARPEFPEENAWTALRAANAETSEKEKSWKLVPEDGFEPSLADSKSAVLPLDDSGSLQTQTSPSNNTLACGCNIRPKTMPL